MKTGGLGQVTTQKKETKKAPGALDPAVVVLAFRV